jgi:hypothetical protein
VAITLTANPTGGNSGYGIVPVTAGTGSTYGGNTGANLSFTATMTAPAAAGTYSYTVWTNQGPTSAGNVGSSVYSITVAGTPPVTTPPVTTPPVTTPPVTTPPVTTPPVTTPPVTTPPVTTPPVVTPPVVTPPVVTPPVVTPPLTPASSAHIRSLSHRSAAIGTKVTVHGTGFGTPGSVKFGTITAVASSWTSTSIVVTVPARAVTPSSISRVPEAVWYRHGENFSVTVTPKDAAASNSMSFVMEPSNKQGNHDSERAPRRDVR